ncbi:MAG: Uma2 family endonuclease [Pseudanabaenaceae cyanobacterium bins.39]|nr:Uma2 family endonuclease [Pseudanabaenaceae cyanobacterium bins.39]
MIAIATSQNPQNATETSQKLTFEQFLELCPNDGHYELVHGKIFRHLDMIFTRNHDDVAEFIDRSFYRQVEKLSLDYVIKRGIAIQTINADGNEQGRIPDVCVVDRQVWRSNRKDYSALREPIQLAVEVASNNWDDDYIDKFDEYQRLGISEYWIVDYWAIASREYLGNPKIPTVFVNLLDENGKYQTSKFTGEDKIISRTFPELDLTAAQIVNI